MPGVIKERQVARLHARSKIIDGGILQRLGSITAVSGHQRNALLHTDRLLASRNLRPRMSARMRVRILAYNALCGYGANLSSPMQR